MVFPQPARGLIAKARRLYVPLDDLIWETGHFGQRFLTPASEAKLFNALKVARRDNWELWVKIILALSGLVGALTGMLAVWKK